MKYQEFVKKVNEIYNTNIFYSPYTFDIEEDDKKEETVYFKDYLDNVYIVDIDLESFEIKNFHSIERKNFSIKLFESMNTNLQEENNNLKCIVYDSKKEIEYLKKIESQNDGIKKFAQETILKAIKGE